MDREVSPTTAPWAHRAWCAPECDFPVGNVEGTHHGPAWTLRPANEQTSRVEVRLYEWVGENTTGQVGVLASVTERKLAEDIDTHGADSDAALGYGLVDITSSAGLSVDEVERLFTQLNALRSEAQKHGANRSEDRSG